MSSIMDLIEPELSEWFALEFAKNAESNLVYTLATANVDQLLPYMVLMYVTVRSWQNGQSYLLFIKKKKKTVIFDFVYTKSVICKYKPFSTKLGQNINVQQNLNEFDHGSDWTGTIEVICSWIGKNCDIRLCLFSSIYKYKPIST